ncbi:hypothetical protein HYV22_02585 [Candidatus Gottesmanbacteria bacterium]|nr:hypothetical protein [Candidatus Gottesmanbacteria bacterium]
MDLTGIRQTVFLDRYALKDETGKPVEKTPEEMWRRVAHAIAQVEPKAKREHWEEQFYDAMQNFILVPGGRILSGAGTGYKVTFYNCFVVPSPADSRGGILKTLGQMVEIMSRGGGVGINLSSLRPRGSRVKKVNGFSSGPCNWAELFSVATKDIIQQGGCFAPGTRIMTHRGLVPVEEIVMGKARSFAATHQGYKEVTARFHNGRKEVYEVTTAAGFRVTATGEHKFVTFNERGEFFLTPLSSLREGDHTVMLLGDWRDDVPCVQLSTSLPEPSKHSWGRKDIVLPEAFTQDLAFLIGAYHADGSKISDEYSPNGKGIRIAMAHDRPEDLKTLLSAITRCFAIEPKIHHGDGAVWDVEIFSRRLNEYLTENKLMKASSVTVTVPEQVFRSPKSVVSAYIAGVFMGDGTNRGGKGGLRITTVSRRFAQELQLLLINVGIASRIAVQERKENLLAPWTEKVADHEVSVRDGAFGWPFNVVNRFAYLANFQRTMARTNPTTSQKAALFLQEHLPQVFQSDQQDVEFLASCVPDEIVSITPKGILPVYDLEVSDTHLLSGNGFYTSNSRRGALMLMLWDWHPDIEEFITVKQDLTRINGANLSVCVSDAFMEAVKNDSDWELVFPDKEDPDYDTKWDGYLSNWLALGKKVIVQKTVKARKIWDLVAEAAWKSAEPGVVFMERYNKWFNNYYWEHVNCVNPCVTGDTIVSTTNGMRTITDLYQEGKPFAVMVDGKPYLSSPVFKTGTKRVYRLKTREGYQLRLTHDHKVYTPSGKVEARQLQQGDNIVLTSGGAFGVHGTLEEGQVLGWLVGDGSMKEDVATLYFYRKEKEELAPRFAAMVSAMVDGEQIVSRSYPVGAQYIEKEDKAVVESVRLWRMAKRYGLSHENKYLVPQTICTGSEAMQRGFLQGLFSSDGHVAGTPKKGVSVRLTSVSHKLLIDVQRLLLNFGIVSKLYQNRRDAGMRRLPDGHGGYKEYTCQAYHDLVIAKSDLHLFASLIGFLQEEKQEKLRSLLATYVRGPYKKSFIATFDGLEEEGMEDVFDITVAGIHRFAANGMIVSNCGEEALPDWGVCNLCSINLAALVTDAGEMDYKRLADIAKIGVRFQDDIVDADFYVFDEISKVQKGGERRIGLGTMGLGDALIKMKLRYGSAESLPVIDKIYRTIRDAAYEASVDIAKEKGAFPKIDIEKHLDAYFIKQLPEDTRKKMKKHGVRNSVVLQQAPTGSTSLLSGVSSGIEPVYEFEFIRRDRLGEHTLRHPLYDAWFDAFKKTNGREPTKEERPGWFVSANDLTPEDHVHVQATIQKYVDASISKTVNAPKTHTVEDVKRLYTLAYELGCKGIAYMREGSRQGVLSRPDSAKASSGKQEEKRAEQSRPEVKPRPMIAHGSTYQIETPVGQAFITINTNGGMQPLEIFINVGKAGSDVTAMAEAMGRLISLTLRMASPIPALDRAHKIAAELIGIGGARSLGFGENRVRSLPDAIAKVIDRHFGFFTKHRLSDSAPDAVNGHTSEDLGTSTPAQQLPLPQTQSQRMVTVDLCPQCGEGSLVFEESCKKCYSCGYSEC